MSSINRRDFGLLVAAAVLLPAGSSRAAEDIKISIDNFTFTFAEPGDYKYFCGLHPHMTGMIKVE